MGTAAAVPVCAPTPRALWIRGVSQVHAYSPHTSTQRVFLGRVNKWLLRQMLGAAQPQSGAAKEMSLAKQARELTASPKIDYAEPSPGEAGLGYATAALVSASEFRYGSVGLAAGHQKLNTTSPHHRSSSRVCVCVCMRASMSARVFVHLPSPRR